MAKEKHPSGMLAGNYTQHLHGNQRLNSTFWTRLKQIEENTTSIPDEIINEVNSFRAEASALRRFAPYKYGGLMESWTTEQLYTPSGISISMHFKDEFHLKLKPGHITIDNFTNPQLVGWLSYKKVSEDKLDRLEYEVDKLARKYTRRIKLLWKEKLK